jgi:precorrin-3B synthase
MPSAAARHDGADACPGAVRVHRAADGALARVRLPGGIVTTAQWRVLCAAAQELGDGQLELTSRGNLQLRGLAIETNLTERLTAAGLLPSPAHERVRNIVASPLSEPVRPLVAALDEGLCADPALTGLSGRFLFAIDDGRGDVAALHPDLLAFGGTWLIFADSLSAVRVEPAKLIATMLEAARRFLAVRGPEVWRLAELSGGPSALGFELEPAPFVPAYEHRIGASGNAFTVGAPLGRLSADQAALLGEVAVEGLVVTPWRTVVLPGVESVTALEAAGLIVDPDSPWAGVSTCAGKPGCAKSLADVRADAAANRPQWTGKPVHWVGCERRCGRPVGDAVEVLATGSGYLVNGVEATDVRTAIDAAR